MASTHATTQAISWASTVNGAVVHAGVLDVGGSVYAPALIHADSEPAFLAAVVAAAPDVLAWIAGEQVTKGMYRTHNGQTWKAASTHVTQTDWQPGAAGVFLWALVEEEPAPGEWAVGVSYVGDNTAGAGNGDVVTYNGTTYRCLQSHTSQAGWTPPVVPALWAVVA